VAFSPDDEAWLATSQGAVEVDGDEVTVYSEEDGLRSAILHGVAWSPAGLLYVAAGGGVGAFDGTTWSYPRELALPVNDMEIGPDDRLWMATDRGLAVYEGGRVRHFDARRGLVENRIEDLALDQFGRVWLRGPQSLGIVAP
jgi:ligand-binding sensor domain-containing protein